MHPFFLVITIACANFELNPVLLTYSLSISAIFVSQLLFKMKLVILGTILLRLDSAIFGAKLFISGISFSTAVNAVFVANPLTSGIFFSTTVNAVFFLNQWFKHCNQSFRQDH